MNWNVSSSVCYNKKNMCNLPLPLIESSFLLIQLFFLTRIIFRAEVSWTSVYFKNHLIWKIDSTVCGFDTHFVYSCYISYQLY